MLRSRRDHDGILAMAATDGSSDKKNGDKHASLAVFKLGRIGGVDAWTFKGQRSDETAPRCSYAPGAPGRPRRADAVQA